MLMVKSADRSVYQAAEPRYQEMPYRRTGTSGLKMSALSLGFWHNFGAQSDTETMRQICRTAFDKGITCFDLANNYGPPYGAAEENFGRILATDLKPYRNEIVITSKAGYDMWSGPYGAGGSKKYLVASCDESLKRLGTDYVDIFYHHCMDPDTPVAESMEALSTIVRSGRALYAGISNYDAAHTRQAMQIAAEIHLPLIVNQRCYSIFDRAVEEDGVKTLCGQNGLGIVAYSPLAQGLLTARYLHGVPQDSRIARGSKFLHSEDLTEKRLAQIRQLHTIAAARGQSLADMALAWLLRGDAVSSVIIGASKPEQIVENTKAVENTAFAADELAAIDAIVKMA
ncbi:MAG: aldo/keto reductase [Gemmiger sp.]|nr:aldo/keto reductase [Gemmiger sp.]